MTWSTGTEVGNSQDPEALRWNGLINREELKECPRKERMDDLPVPDPDLHVVRLRYAKSLRHTEYPGKLLNIQE